MTRAVTRVPFFRDELRRVLQNKIVDEYLWPRRLVVPAEQPGAIGVPVLAPEQEDRRALEALEVPKFELSLGVLRPFDLSMGNLTGDLGDLAEYLADFRKVLGNGTDNQDILRLTSDLVTEFGDRLQAANLANLDFGDQREVLAFIANLTERTDLVERLANLTGSEVIATDGH
ncbi:hypothetical protein Ctob_010348 [Chrysochromulina tobinii]|uniref:Uncharacterized protein n=1 Tax=Chrysochromulina tobinii TaxID=1460289 RepID=A0A0M0JMV0_9EUKA|nr:hypothetical protein Ctob_010348 [Chrysochromulina tobinii]|eukprot:KOO27919.1 hypothetical protein Ctob_010348 [Chrysochromulina sp. CCMP291]